MDTDAIITKIILEVNTLKNTVAHLEKLEVPISAGGGGGGYVTDHALLSHLEYSAAGHTNFQPVISWPLAASAGGTGVANGASAALTLANAALWLDGGGAASKLTLPNAAIDIQGGGAASILKLPNAAIELAGGGASGKLTLPNAATTISGGGTLALATFTLTVAGTASIIGTNTGDVTLASPNHGLGLTNQVITLGTPSTLTTITTNGVTTTTHAHAVTNSANPGAAASILASDANGYLTLVKLLTDTLADKSGGNLTISPTGDCILDPVGNDVLPNLGYDINLGSLAKKYLTLHAAELWVETLVAQNTIATIGGRILVGPTTELTEDLGSAATHMHVKHNQMAVGDVGYFEANALVEFIDIDGTALVSASAVQDLFLVATNLTAIYTAGVKFAIYGTPAGVNDGVWTVDHSTYSAPNTAIYVVEDVTSNNYAGGMIVWRALAAIGPYTYDITRNLDGSGANDWSAGDACFNTGATGDGFIDLYSINGIKAGTEYGPTIVGNVRASAAYNNWGPRWAIGNLNGLYGYGTDLYGAAFGQYASGKANVTIDETNGFRLRSYTTDILQIKNTDGLGYIVGPLYLDTNGGIYQGTGTFASPTTGLKIWNDTGIGRIGGYAATVLQWYANTDGKLYCGTGVVALSAGGILITSPATQASSAAYKFADGGGELGGLYCESSASSVHPILEAKSFASRNSQIDIQAASPSTYASRINLAAACVADNTTLTVENDSNGRNAVFVTGHGLSIGDSVVTGVAEGSLYVELDERVGGGLYVGSVATDPAAGTLVVEFPDAGTNNQVTPLYLRHSTSNTPAANFGLGVVFQADDDGDENQNQGYIETRWTEATHATRKARLTLATYDTAWREIMRGQASGSAPMVGFLGAAAVVRAAHIAVATDLTTAIARIAAIEIVLEDLGFVATA